MAKSERRTSLRQIYGQPQSKTNPLATTRSPARKKNFKLANYIAKKQMLWSRNAPHALQSRLILMVTAIASKTYFMNSKETQTKAKWTDRELLKAVIENDETAFRVLAGRHHSRIFGVCFRILRNEHDAQDVFQETLLSLLRNATKIRNRQSVASWLCSVAYHESLKTLDRRSRRREMPLEGQLAFSLDDQLELLTHRHQWSVLDDELKRMPEKYRETIVMHYLGGMTLAQIAKEQNQSLGTIQGRLRRGRNDLRRRLLCRGFVFAACALASVGNCEASSQASAKALCTFLANRVGNSIVGGTKHMPIFGQQLLQRLVCLGLLLLMVGLGVTTFQFLNHGAKVVPDILVDFDSTREMRPPPIGVRSQSSAFAGSTLILFVYQEPAYAKSFEELLERNGFSVDLRKRNDFLDADLSDYSIIILGKGFELQNSPLMVQSLAKFQKPIIAIGRNGHNTLIATGLSLGDRRRASLNNHSQVEVPTNYSNKTMNEFSVTVDNSHAVATGIAVTSNHDWEKIELIGKVCDRAPRRFDYYTVVRQGAWFFWGYETPVENLSDNAKELFLKLCRLSAD